MEVGFRDFVVSIFLFFSKFLFARNYGFKLKRRAGAATKLKKPRVSVIKISRVLSIGPMWTRAGLSPEE